MSRRGAYVCADCGAAHAKWAGRCDACGGWNTIAEEPETAASPRPAARGRRLKLSGLTGGEAPPPRGATGIGELDRVLGGGLVAG